MPTDIQNIHKWEFWRLLRIGAVQVRVRQGNQRNHHQKEMIAVYLGEGWLVRGRGGNGQR